MLEMTEEDYLDNRENLFRGLLRTRIKELHREGRLNVSEETLRNAYPEPLRHTGPKRVATNEDIRRATDSFVATYLESGPELDKEILKSDDFLLRVIYNACEQLSDMRDARSSHSFQESLARIRLDEALALERTEHIRYVG